MFCFSPVPAPSASGDQERAELAAGRRHLEARQALYAELVELISAFRAASSPMAFLMARVSTCRSSAYRCRGR